MSLFYQSIRIESTFSKIISRAICIFEDVLSIFENFKMFLCIFWTKNSGVLFWKYEIDNFSLAGFN